MLSGYLVCGNLPFLGVIPWMSWLPVADFKYAWHEKVGSVRRCGNHSNIRMSERWSMLSNLNGQLASPKGNRMVAGKVQRGLQ